MKRSSLHIFQQCAAESGASQNKETSEGKKKDCSTLTDLQAAAFTAANRQSFNTTVFIRVKLEDGLSHLWPD